MQQFCFNLFHFSCNFNRLVFNYVFLLLNFYLSTSVRFSDRFKFNFWLAYEVLSHVLFLKQRFSMRFNLIEFERQINFPLKITLRTSYSVPSAVSVIENWFLKKKGFQVLISFSRTCVYRNDSSREKEATDAPGNGAKVSGDEPCPRFAHQLVYDYVKKVRLSRQWPSARSLTENRSKFEQRIDLPWSRDQSTGQ